ncbi:OmpL47-type beta-barrel domain-containing protein [Caldalkalibacillus salinus]|uniref:OmpL47-type beta-barrel domain-containing protein n=1 Tax=Caldalkalibacillus salinus TaxID=2803787 RepID=UPI0019236E89|nr:hypothetical protein [Caldalkalibacillus salinus]
MRRKKHIAILLMLALILQAFLPLGSVMAEEEEVQVPTNVNVQEYSPSNVRITWEEIIGVDYYRVYEVSGETPVLINEERYNRSIIRGLDEGRYAYAVTAVKDEQESSLSESASIDIIYPELQAPSNAEYSIRNGNDILLQWEEADYAEQYNVYLVEDGNRTTVDNTERTYAWLRDMPEGEYHIEVTTYHGTIGESDPASLEVPLVHPDMQPPEDFTYFTRNGNDIVLRWSEAEYANEYMIYEIEDGERVSVGETDRTTFTLRDMPEKSYQIELVSYSDRFGVSSAVSELTVDLIHPEMEAPEGVNHDIRNGNDILLRWDEVEFATEYRVYQVTEEGKFELGSNDRENFWLRDMSAGSHKFEITSYSDRFGESPTVEYTLELEEVEMEAPTHLTHSIRNGNDIYFRWSEVDFATEYRIYHMIDHERHLLDSTDRNYQWLRNMPAGTHNFEITSYSDRFGESQGTKYTVKLEEPEMEAPTGINHLVRNGNDLYINWDEVDLSTEYRVYMINDEEERELIGSTDREYHWVRDMPAGTYHFEITSYSDRFGESLGTPYTVELQEVEMESPSNFEYVIRNGNDVILRWDEVDLATEYRVYDVTTGERNDLGTTDRLNTWVRNLEEGTYEFELTSYSDRFGESQPARIQVEISFPELDRPDSFENLIRNGNEVLLRWDEVEHATEYQLYEVVDGESVFLTSTERTYYSVRDLPEGSYKYELVAYSDRFGESQPAQTVATIIYPDVEVPQLRLSSVGDDWASLAWRYISDIEAYNVYQLTDDEPQYIGTTSRTGYKVEDIEEGTHQYVVTAVHKRFGESDYSNAVEVEIISDITPPETTSNITDEWLNTSFTVELTATDDKSGVESTYYAVNGAEFTEGTHFTIEEEGVHEVRYYSVDVAGNVEEEHVEEVKIDLTVPSTTSNISDEWHNASFTVELTSEDNLSGVESTYYAVNGGEFTEGTHFTIEEEGVHEVR